MVISKRKEEERTLRKEKILIGALEVFKQFGVENSTMDQIASESGFGTATIYYYFHSKEEIYSAILINGWERLWKNIEPIISIKYDSPRKIFIAILIKTSEVVRNRPGLYEFLFNVPKQMSFKKEPWKKDQERLYKTLISLLRESIELGEFPNIDPNLLFKALGGLFMGVVLMGNKDKPISERDIEKLLHQIIANPAHE